MTINVSLVIAIFIISAIGFYNCIFGTKKEREERKFRETHKRICEPLIENGKMIGVQVTWIERD